VTFRSIRLRPADNLRVTGFSLSGSAKRRRQNRRFTFLAGFALTTRFRPSRGTHLMPASGRACAYRIGNLRQPRSALVSGFARRVARDITLAEISARFSPSPRRWNQSRMARVTATPSCRVLAFRERARTLKSHAKTYGGVKGRTCANDKYFLGLRKEALCMIYKFEVPRISRRRS